MCVSSAAKSGVGKMSYQCKGCGKELDPLHNFLPYCNNECIDKYKQKLEDNMEISKEEFEAYEAVRESGITNMFDVNMVSALSGLDRTQITTIMKQYSDLCDKYPGVRK